MAAGQKPCVAPVWHSDESQPSSSSQWSAQNQYVWQPALSSAPHASLAFTAVCFRPWWHLCGAAAAAIRLSVITTGRAYKASDRRGQAAYYHVLARTKTMSLLSRHSTRVCSYLCSPLTRLVCPSDRPQRSSSSMVRAQSVCAAAQICYSGFVSDSFVSRLSVLDPGGAGVAQRQPRRRLSVINHGSRLYGERPPQPCRVSSMC